MKKTYGVAVVGGGIAGYSAALTLKSLRADYIWLGEEGFGEKLQKSEYVRNFPAVQGDGMAFLRQLEAQKEQEGVLLTPARIDGIYATDAGYMLTAGNDVYTATSVILATGVETAGTLVGEREFLGRGVSYCAVCDGALYKGKEIAVVISSERFQEEVEYLASFAKTVYAICYYRNPVFRANNVQIIKDAPLAIRGNLRVQALECKKNTYEVSGVFFLKNAAPPSALVGGLQTEGAHVSVARDLSTNLPGLFAAGDVTGKPYQFVKAAGEGNVAAYSAVEYLKTRKKEEEV